MKAKYDDTAIELTQTYIDALKQVLIAEVEMMQAAESELPIVGIGDVPMSVI